MIEFFFDCSSPWTAGIAEQAIKDHLKANTGEVMARGGFGSPTIFIDKTDMYFGNDRLPLVREALQRRKVRADGAESAA
jgi:2-hydroxychromene-2-carboxylate isomerase